MNSTFSPARLVVGLLIPVVGSFYIGWVVSTLWNWFATIPPLSLPSVGVAHTAGLLILFYIVRGIRVVDEPRDFADMTTDITAKWTVVLLLLGVAAIAKQFV